MASGHWELRDDGSPLSPSSPEGHILRGRKGQTQWMPALNHRGHRPPHGLPAASGLERPSIFSEGLWISDHWQRGGPLPTVPQLPTSTGDSSGILGRPLRARSLVAYVLHRRDPFSLMGRSAESQAKLTSSSWEPFALSAQTSIWTHIPGTESTEVQSRGGQGSWLQLLPTFREGTVEQESLE